jgi:hypothetical protein
MRLHFGRPPRKVSPAGAALDGLNCLWFYAGIGLAYAEEGDGTALYAMYYGMFADMHSQAPDMVCHISRGSFEHS